MLNRTRWLRAAPLLFAAALLVVGTTPRTGSEARQPAVTPVPRPQTLILAASNPIGATPPMGWNGYNRFKRSVNAALVEAEARALVSAGLKAAGYRYVNLDGGWDLAWRDRSGNLQPDPAKFPDGIKPVADYVHSLGLGFGIYTSAGVYNCAHTSAGSYRHYQQDANTFAAWGVDYVKLDWCFIPYRDFHGAPKPRVSALLAMEMGNALRATRRPILFDVNDWTQGGAWSWARGIATMWRVTPDITNTFGSVLRNFKADVRLHRSAGPGGWNDPDMLEVGNPGLSLTEQRTQFSLWSEMAAPLIAGNDLTTMSAPEAQVLTNRSVIAADQDRLGIQCSVVSSAKGRWVLTKPLADGGRAIVLFNETGRAVRISTSAVRAGLPARRHYRLLNLWTGTNVLGAGQITELVPAHAVVMYRVSAA